MLVIDASVVLPACGSPDGFDVFGDEPLVAPPLMWSEARSAIHEALWRGEISRTYALRTAERLESSPVRVRSLRRIGRMAWELSDELGWAKTYDAEYVALTQLQADAFVTLDAELARAVEKVVPTARIEALRKA